MSSFDTMITHYFSSMYRVIFLSISIELVGSTAFLYYTPTLLMTVYRDPSYVTLFFVIFLLTYLIANLYSMNTVEKQGRKSQMVNGTGLLLPSLLVITYIYNVDYSLLS